MRRREFLKTMAASGAAITMSKLSKVLGDEVSVAGESGGKSTAPVLQRRPYGKGGVKLSVVGFGGLCLSGVEQSHADKVVAKAVEKGVNYFDVAPTYGDAELKLGPALQPYRKKVFLACKTIQRKAEGVRGELKSSLKRLRTDHLDLYQMHGLTGVEKDVDAAFAKDGAMEAFKEAKKAGLVRHLGFSAHSEEAALAAMDRYDFDSVMFPINFACWLADDFGRRVIEKAEAKNVAVLAIKALARQQWPSKRHPDRKKFAKCWYQPASDRREAELALRFTLSQPVTAAISPGEEALLWLAVDIAKDFKPITPAEQQQLKALAAKLNPIFTHKGS